MKLSIVVPCFNEPDNIPLVVEAFATLTQKHSEIAEVIWVDGASTDQTPRVLESEIKKRASPRLKCVLMNERRGYGYDIVHGLGQTTGDVLAWTHSDLQTDPADVLRAFSTFCEKGSQAFVKGKRKKRRLSEAVFTFGMQLVTAALLRIYLDDINAQPKLFSRQFYDAYLKKGAPSDFSLDLYALYQAKRNGYQIATVPVFFLNRLHGEAKGGGGSWSARWKLIQRTFRYILTLRREFRL